MSVGLSGMRTGVWWGKGTVGELGLLRRIILKWNLNRVLDRELGYVAYDCNK